MRRSSSIRALIATAAALAAVAALPALAAAQQVSPYEFSSSFNGALSTTGPLGHRISDLDVNEETGRVYVETVANNATVIDQFDAAGNPVPFSALRGSSAIAPTPPIGGQENGAVFTVDNSGGAHQGRIIAPASNNGKIYAFNPDGTAVGAPFPIEGYPVGLAVNTKTHDLWTDDHNGEQQIERYTPTYDRSTTAFSVYTQGAIRFAIDGEGYFYIAQRRGVSKWTESGEYLYTLEFTGNLQYNMDVAVDTTTGDVFTVDEREGVRRVAEFNSRGTKIGTFGAGVITPNSFESGGIAVNSATGTVYVGDPANERVDIFKPKAPVALPEATVLPPSEVKPTEVTMRANLEPAGGPTTKCSFVWGTETKYEFGSEKEVQGEIPCSQGNVIAANGTVSAKLPGLTKGSLYFYRLLVETANGPVNTLDQAFSPADPPTVSAIYATDVHSDTADLHGTINPGGGPTTYYFEYGTGPCLEGTGGCAHTPTRSAGGGLADVTESEVISHLTPGATYHYQLVATNAAATTRGVERTIVTFGNAAQPIEGCPNSHERQQTGAAVLLDCRAYELVSAADTGGYDVESSLIQTQTPFLSYPSAVDRVLYGTEGGGIPNVGFPTNHGLDPYVATRGATGWSTLYVGIPSNDPYATEAFSSTLLEASAGLGGFAFGGAEICSPCFADGSRGIPVRLPNGTLVQGMVGSIAHPNAEPSGYVAHSLSATGEDLVFGTTSQLEPAGNTNGDVTIYERDLLAGHTEVVSTLPSGATMTGANIAELGLAEDGGRAVVATGVATDAKGNTLWHPYMHFAGSAASVDLAPGTTSGVYFDGMSGGGSRVFFTTVDKLLPADTDGSADIYEATVSGPGQPASLRLVSVGTAAGNGTACTPAENWNVPAGTGNCGVVAIGGGGGVSADGGTVYFLSPELLDGGGAGVANQPNLYVARGGGPAQFVATIDSDAEGPIADPTVLEAVAHPERRRYADFQVTPDGGYAAFPSTQSLTGYASEGQSEIFRYATVGGPRLACVSCAPTNAKSEGGTTLPVGGLGLTPDGRVFFSTDDALSLQDLNKLTDAYEWENGTTQVISTGTSPSPSAMLGVSADGTDAFFFTRDQLVPQDANGNHVKIYDARANGGFAFTPEPVPCKAADECHGPSSEPAPSPPINTVGGQGGNHLPKPKCKKGKTRKHGHCVAKHKKRQHHKKKSSPKRSGGHA